MICENRGFASAFSHTAAGSMNCNVADSGNFPVLTFQSGDHVSPSFPTLSHGVSQEIQQFGAMSDQESLLDSANYAMKPRPLHWCFGLQSDVAKEWSLLLNKSGMPAAGSKVAAESSIEGGAVIVRGQLCPWSMSNVHHTNRCAAVDPIRFQRILDDAFSSDARRVDSRHEGWCKYCATLEKELTTALAGAVEAKEKWVDENSWADLDFKPVDQQFESRTMPLAQQPDNRKRKFETLDTRQDDWENDRALVLVKLNELNSRANLAEQRVLELEQVLRQHALGALDDTCDDSDIVTCASQHNCFSEEHSETLVCKMAGCNKSFKSSKTLRRHVLQKHSDKARFLVCNQTTVKGEMCRFETIHSGVLSYHRKHSLAHQRREDWHIACPFCHSKFARQHEMERHRRICKSRPVAAVPSSSIMSPTSNGSSTFSGLSTRQLQQQQQHQQQHQQHLQHQQHALLADFLVPDCSHHLFKMSDSNCIDSSITF